MAGLVILLSAFLFLLAVLAGAAVFFFAPRDAQGKRTAAGCLGGCAMFVFLIVVGVAGLGLFTAGVAALSEHAESTRQAIRQAERSEREVPPAPVPEEALAERHPDLRVALEWNGHSQPTPALLEELASVCEGKVFELSESAYQQNKSGKDITVLHIWLPGNARDASKLERDLRRRLGRMERGDSPKVVVRSVEVDDVR